MSDASTLPYYRMFIDGEWEDGADGQVLLSDNPATGHPWARFACAAKADVQRAVGAARRALNQGAWPGLKRHPKGRAALSSC